MPIPRPPQDHSDATRPAAPAPRDGVVLPRKLLLWVGLAFVVGLLLFLLLVAGRKDDEGFFRAAPTTGGNGQDFEPLPTPDADGASTGSAPVDTPDEGRSIVGTGDSAAGNIEPPIDASPLPPAVATPPGTLPGAPVASSGASTSARPVRSPRPSYPPQALRRGESGTVLLQVHVDASGRPEQVQVVQSSRSRALDREAVRAVERWEFAPATRGGQPVASRVLVPIDFNR